MVDCSSGLSSWSWTGDGVLIREIENRPCTLGVSVKDRSPTASIAEVEALLADAGVLGVAGVEDGVGALFEPDGDFWGLGDGVLTLVLGDLLAGDGVLALVLGDLLAGDGVLAMVLGDLLAGDRVFARDAVCLGEALFEELFWAPGKVSSSRRALKNKEGKLD